MGDDGQEAEDVVAALEPLLTPWSGEWWHSLLIRALPSFATPEVELSCGGGSDRYENGVTVSLPDAACRALGKLLASRASAAVRRLRLCYNTAVGAAGLEDLCRGLRCNGQLEELSLYGTGVPSLDPLLDTVREDNNALVAVDARETPAAQDAPALRRLDWALCVNRQPLRLKHHLVPLQQHSVNLRELVLDDHRSLRLCDDDAVRIILAALTGVEPSCDPFPPACFLSRNTQLRKLHLPRNAVTHAGCALLALFLPTDTVLTDLDLSQNPLGATGCSSLAAALTPPSGNSTLLQLQLCGVGAGDAGGTAIAQMVSRTETLAALKLQDNGFRQCGAAFVRAVHINTSLEVIDLGSNPIDPELLERVAEKGLLQRCPAAVRRNVPRLHADSAELTELNLDASRAATGEGGGVDDAALRILCAALAGNTQLRLLSLSENPLTFAGFRELCTALREGAASGLRTLWLQRLRLEPRTAQERETGTQPAARLCAALEAHPALAEADLSGSYLEEGAGALLLETVRRCRRLRVLLADGCPPHAVSEEERERLRMATASHAFPPPLTNLCWQLWEGGIADGELDLSRGGLLCGGHPVAERPRDTGAAMTLLCECLGKLPGISVVDISEQPELGDDGARTLGRLIAAQPTLTGLRARSCHLTTGTALELADCVQKHIRVRVADLAGNPEIRPDAADLLETALRFNLAPPHLQRILVQLQVSADGTEITHADPPSGEELDDAATEWMAQTAIEAADRLGHGALRCFDLSNNHLTGKTCLHLHLLLRHTAGSRLESLRLRNCMITGAWDAPQKLMATAAGCPQLTELDLSCNDIGPAGRDAALAALASSDTLTTLSLAGDARLELSDQQQLETAQELNRRVEVKHALAAARRGGAGDVAAEGANVALVRAVAAAIPCSPKLLSIDLSRGSVDDSGVGYLCTALHEQPPLQRLGLSHNRITTHGCRLLASAVAGSHHLRELLLDHNLIDSRGASAMIDALRTNTSLMRLELQGNAQIPLLMLGFVSRALINDQPALKTALPRLMVNDDSLTELDLRGGGEQAAPSEVTLRLVGEALSLNTRVKACNLSGGTVCGDGARHVADMLSANVGLEVLYLDDCGLGDGGGIVIAEALRGNSSLHELYLRNNRLTSAFCTALNATLRDGGNYALKQVYLDGNLLCEGDEELRVLCEELSLNRCPLALKALTPHLNAGGLTRVVLSSHPATPIWDLHDDETALRVAAALRISPSVRLVDLSGNKIGVPGGQALADMLLECPALLVLDLRGNRGMGDAGNALRTALFKNSTLRRLEMADCGVPAPTMEVAALLTECNSHPPQLKHYVKRYLDGEEIPELRIVPSEDGGTLEDCLEDEDYSDLHLPPQHRVADDRTAEILCDWLNVRGGAAAVCLQGALTSAGACRVAAVLCGSAGTTIHSCDLSHNSIDDEGGCAIAAALKVSKALRLISLSENKLSDSTVLQVMEVVRGRGEIEDVDLSENEGVSDLRMEELNWLLTLNHKAIDFRELALRLVDGDPALTCLDCRGWTGCGNFDTPGQGYSPDSLPLLLSAARRSNHVQTIDLSVNGRELAEGIPAVAAYLRSSMVLQRVILSHNPLGAPGVVDPVLRVLRYSLCIREIGLRSCGLTDEVWDSVLAVLEGSTTCELYDLRDNLLTDALLPRITEFFEGTWRLCSDRGLLIHPQRQEAPPFAEGALAEASLWVRLSEEEDTERVRLRELRLAPLRGRADAQRRQ